MKYAPANYIICLKILKILKILYENREDATLIIIIKLFCVFLEIIIYLNNFNKLMLMIWLTEG